MESYVIFFPDFCCTLDAWLYNLFEIAHCEGELVVEKTKCLLS